MKKIPFISLVAFIAANSCPAQFVDIGKLIDSSDTWIPSDEDQYPEASYFPNRFNYAYAPSIIYQDGIFHMYMASDGYATNPTDHHHMDDVVYTKSIDGRIWSKPLDIVRTSDPFVPYGNGSERAVCDPSVVYFNGYYYMFYTGNRQGVQSLIFVARSLSLNGPFKKWTENSTWVENASNPKALITPYQSSADGSGVYGAGQSAVVSQNGVLHMWYTDTTAPGGTIRYKNSTNPTNWSNGILGVDTDITDPSVDVKWDPSIGKFVMFSLASMHGKQSYLRKRTSTNGVSWSAPQTISNSSSFRDYSHNLGVSGTREGHLIDGRALIAYGAPYAELAIDDSKAMQQREDWGHWDIYAGVLNPSGDVWNEVPWGWEGLELGSDCELALGDYDGDGKTDRAIVDRATSKWYVVSSLTGQNGIASSSIANAIPWGWPWSGMTSAYELAVGDYDGDGISDRAIVNKTNGSWYVLSSKPGYFFSPEFSWGWQGPSLTSGRVLALGDYDGDGKTDRTVVDVPQGKWYVMSSQTGLQGIDKSESIHDIPWGWSWMGMGASHTPIVADWDGDGQSDRAIVNNDSGNWYVTSTLPGNFETPMFPWGWDWIGMHSGHTVVNADYDGDGRWDRAIVDKILGSWLVLVSGPGYGDHFHPDIPWGWASPWPYLEPNDDVAPGDFDGDGIADRVVIKNLEGVSKWYVIGSKPFEIY